MAQKTNTASDSSTSARPIVSEASTSSSFSTCTEISEVSPEESNLPIHHFDLGNYVGNKLDDNLKFKLLSTPWTPGEDFKFPVSVSGKKNLRFQRQWLVYTENDSALCKYCVLFSHHTVGKGGNQAPKSLVTVSYKKWKHAIEDFKSHQSKQYHHEAVVKGSNFLRIMQNQHLDIRNVIDSGRRKQVEENREKLFSIVETIKFCGHQELALRGTNDSGPVSVTDEEPVTNDGNFRAILRMRMKCGDTKLLKHSENIALNATYMSAKVQNDLISICGEIIQKEIVKCLNEAKVFSVLVDETADISGHEQLLLCVRYTKKVETCYVVKEDFLGFVKVDNTTAQPLADMIIASLKNLDIDCNNMVGQGYDGAAVMKEAKDLLADVNEEIKLPRLTSVQKHGANPNTNNPEQYYRITVAIPLLEELTSQLKIRFTDHKKVIAAMYTLIQQSVPRRKRHSQERTWWN
ncbi:hypothetical protein JTB14_016599 [Gonioctena quinquepunctata]|nr:hypothetical protein JTB14_016599 [Gonioctena quinquepunctata]